MENKFTNILLEIYRQSEIIECESALLDAFYELGYNPEVFESKQIVWKRANDRRKTRMMLRSSLIKSAMKKAAFVPASERYIRLIETCYQAG